ncbi:hypothetical protein NHX12_034006 [Muraenolepis orangiensis]|uniref:Uncharacterized protein n=1 Tax=Muraenolepis orangiensis TaxID=630683 RepID=A0A9Q0IIH3_9TELE|nr:hypothetical protein NHX12_034006 [Muraenolepis orangiensis]
MGTCPALLPVFLTYFQLRGIINTPKRMAVQLIKQLETLPAYKETLESFTAQPSQKVERGTLNHLSSVNQRMEEGVQKHAPLHRDLAKTQLKRDAEAIELALKWFKENNPFDHDRDKEMLVSFCTGFTSKGDAPVNAEREAEVGREIQNKLDG